MFGTNPQRAKKAHAGLKRQLTFLSGSTNFKVDAVTDHETSHAHKLAEMKCLPIQETSAGKAIITLQQDIVDKMVPMFRNAHALAKHDGSFKKFCLALRA